MNIDFKSDFKEVYKMYKDMPGLVEDSAKTALNRTRNKTFTATSRAISQKLQLPVKVVKSNLRKVNATKSTLKATIISKGKALNIIHFKSAKTNKGIKATVWGKRRLYDRSFIVNINKRSDSKKVFARLGKPRLPIYELYGPSIPETMLEGEILKIMQDVAGKAWQKNFASAMIFNLNKRKY